VISGLISATLLTLIVLPTLYHLFEERFPSRRHPEALAEAGD
jgi:Cu/Ag efflux pump CusA